MKGVHMTRKGEIEWYECKAGDMRLSHKVMTKLLSIIKQEGKINLQKQKQYWNGLKTMKINNLFKKFVRI